MKKINMGVVYVIAHLIITLTVVGGYLFLYVKTGVSDETFKLALYTIIGYWFGAMGKDAIDKAKSKE